MCNTVLIVDDEDHVRTMLQDVLEELGYRSNCASDGEAALRSLERHRPDLVLLDVLLPGIDGAAVLKQIVAGDKELPVVMMSSLDEVQRVRQSLRNGAYDYLLKPLDITELDHTIRKALDHAILQRERRHYREQLEETVQERTRELQAALEKIENTYHSTILALGSALEMRDVETQTHSLRVSRYTRMIAIAHGITDAKRLDRMERAAYLHDIGKIAVPDAILKKEGALDEQEWKLVRQHPVVGARLLERIEFLHDAIPLIVSHHERWDGAGYPAGLRGEAIPIDARIFAVADTLDAITSDRPYRKGRPYRVARDVIVTESGSQFDPAVVHAFLAVPENSVQNARSD